MFENIKISWLFFFLFLITGFVIGSVYFLSLWKSLQHLTKIHKKGLFLFLTTLLRIALFVFIMILLTGLHAGNILSFTLGFIFSQFLFKTLLKKGKENK